MEFIKNTNQVYTIKEQVYNIVKENILNGNFKPGERLQEKKIAEQLNVSRSPVREVLKELIGEGLLESIPNKSIRVRKLSKKDIIDIYELRYVMEKYALQKTIENLTEDKIKLLDEILDKMEKSYSEGNFNEYCKTDVQLHDQILVMSENKVAYNAFKNIFSLMQPFRIISLHNKKRFEESFNEHKMIIEGIKEKDFSKSWKYNSHHLKYAKEQILKYLEEE
ncbi:GntR family transcriptional regulator [Clostridiaceae bacterium M8S5]|nr:GntR family transcriptional regulator [Clostridiaceae bacterium M8S5]